MKDKEIIITTDIIKKAVCEFYGLHMRELMSKSKFSEYMYPRQVAMFLCRKLTKLSYPQIAVKFDKDHSTIMHNVKKIEKLFNNEYKPKYRQELMILHNKIVYGSE